MSPTTSASAPSSTPSSPAFQFPTILPRKEQPNTHPYAIKTSSTAILSRSNSTSNHASAGPHHYVPMSPSPTSPHNSPTKMHRSSRHRYSRSLTSDLPPPLPGPPGAVSNHSEEDNTPTKFGRRAEALPSSAGPLLRDLDLPDDPKSWAPSQLSTYLSATLRTGDANLPAPVARDIVNFVNEHRITGKTFLRFSEDDLLQYVLSFLYICNIRTLTTSICCKSTFFTCLIPLFHCFTAANTRPTGSESTNSGVRLFFLHLADYDRQFCVAEFGALVIHLKTKKTTLVMPRSRLLRVPMEQKPQGQEVGIQVLRAITEGSKA